MRAILAILAILALGASGCATSWIITEASGVPHILDEGIQEASVPVPGVQEQITITLPLGIDPVSPTAYGAAPVEPPPFTIGCSIDQHARDVVYHSAFRYGKRWKLASGVMALLEGALATTFILTRDQKPEYVLYGGVLAIDAAITSALFFIPRKEVYREYDKPSVTHLRSDCPDGLALAIGADRFPVDAAGRIGELGIAALDAWMTQPTGAIQIEVAGQSRYVNIGPGEQCIWRTDHRAAAAGPIEHCYPGVALRSILISIEVAPGALSTASLP